MFLKVLAIFLICVIPTLSLTFTIEPKRKTCFYEQLEASTNAHVDFQVVKGGDLMVSFRITDPIGRNTYTKIQFSTGTYNFRTNTQGIYSFCFDNSRSSFHQKEVTFNFESHKAGELKKKVEKSDFANYTDKKGEISGKQAAIELAGFLELLGEKVTEVHTLQTYLKAREKANRDTTESTNSRILWWSLFSTLLIVVGSITQIYYLKSIFMKRRSRI
eukprot:Anaeramoba_flamelloidesa87549_120.p1 GENE.a87549_120~~a87549_120.p1  ORF type:complete len:217 (+),score=33.53 a87549_120:1-651(+)